MTKSSYTARPLFDFATSSFAVNVDDTIITTLLQSNIESLRELVFHAFQGCLMNVMHNGGQSKKDIQQALERGGFNFHRLTGKERKTGKYEVTGIIPSKDTYDEAANNKMNIAAKIWLEKAIHYSVFFSAAIMDGWTDEEKGWNLTTEQRNPNSIVQTMYIALAESANPQQENRVLLSYAFPKLALLSDALFHAEHKVLDDSSPIDSLMYFASRDGSGILDNRDQEKHYHLALQEAERISAELDSIESRAKDINKRHKSNVQRSSAGKRSAESRKLSGEEVRKTYREEAQNLWNASQRLSVNAVVNRLHERNLLHSDNARGKTMIIEYIRDLKPTRK